MRKPPSPSSSFGVTFGEGEFMNFSNISRLLRKLNERHFSLICLNLESGITANLCYIVTRPDLLQQLLEVPIDNDDEDKYISTNDDDPHANLILEAIKNDSLRRLERIKKHESEHCILTAAKLISPMIEDRWGHFETKLFLCVV